MARPVRSFAYALSLMGWDMFGTLTHKNPLPPLHKRWASAWLHLRAMGKISNRPYSSLRIVLRLERGEKFGRPHFHYLLGGGRFSNIRSACLIGAADWKHFTGGHAEIRPYSPDLGGEDYVVDGIEANFYELEKFNRSDVLQLSRSVILLAKRARVYAEGDGQQPRQDEKTQGLTPNETCGQVDGASIVKEKVTLPFPLLGADRVRPAQAWVADRVGNFHVAPQTTISTFPAPTY